MIVSSCRVAFLTLGCLVFCATGLEFEITNKYKQEYGSPGQHLQWLKGKEIVEPYMETILSVTSPNPSAEYVWVVKTKEGQVLAEEEGSATSYTFTDIGDYQIFVTERVGEQMSVESQDVVSKYVRREIRKLFTEDRKDLLDAMKTLWTLDDEEGKEVYGDGYTSIFSLLKYHLILAGDRTCDHIHDGYGFISHHSALSLLFEKSLQVIDPKLSLPYWDYIYDIEEWSRVIPANRWDFTQSELFSEEYFGKTDTETHYIADGRWANLEVPTIDMLPEEEQEGMPHNVYGYMRSPWSNNDDPHLMRAETVCGSLSTKSVDSAGRCISLNYLWAKDTFEDFGYYISYMPHGRIHLLAGGAMGCDDAYDELYSAGVKPSDVNSMKSLAFAMQKDLYRWERIECDLKQSCYCPDLDTMLEDEDIMDGFLNDALFELHMTHYDFDVKQKIVSAICNSDLIDGDNLQSSSSYSPEFWPIHPAVERMYQVKKLGKKVDPFTDLTWPEEGSWLVYSDECVGHDADEPVLAGMAEIPFGDEYRKFTNQEYLDLLDVADDTGISYIYDDLDWDYCITEFGVDIYA